MKTRKGAGTGTSRSPSPGAMEMLPTHPSGRGGGSAQYKLWKGHEAESSHCASESGGREPPSQAPLPGSENPILGWGHWTDPLPRESSDGFSRGNQRLGIGISQPEGGSAGPSRQSQESWRMWRSSLSSAEMPPYSPLPPQHYGGRKCEKQLSTRLL